MAHHAAKKLSVIIPVLNEAENIAIALASIKSAEIIVVDGGSQDRTVEIVQALGVKVLLSQYC